MLILVVYAVVALLMGVNEPRGTFGQSGSMTPPLLRLDPPAIVGRAGVVDGGTLEIHSGGGSLRLTASGAALDGLHKASADTRYSVSTGVSTHYML